jgi:hypothetical protein
MTGPMRILHLVLGSSLILALSSLAKAELLVSEVFGTETIVAGTKFPDDHVFDLPARSEIRVIRLRDNAPFVMRGHYKGTLSKFIKDCTPILGLITMTSYCKENPSGDVVSPGATRSIGTHQ